MRKIVIIGGFALALVALAPAVPSLAASSHDQAVGTGTLAQFGDPTAHVNANATPAGLKGSFTIEYPDGTSTSGTPTCLVVSGTTAYVTGRIAQAGGPRAQTNAWSPGRYLIIGVQDNGNPGTRGPDRLNFSPGFATDPGCGPNSAATPNLNIVAGNFQVSGGSTAKK